MKAKNTYLSMSYGKFSRGCIFSLANIPSHLHKDRAFQASSPKTFRAGPHGPALFLMFAMRPLRAWLLSIISLLGPGLVMIH